jgi:hypothetical protein
LIINTIALMNETFYMEGSKGEETDGSSLDAWSREIECALEHPNGMLYLARRLLCILATRNHVQSGPLKHVITKDDLLSRDGLSIHPHKRHACKWHGRKK